VDRFEYLSVLVSIVIALGMSEVVSTWGRLLRQRNEVKFSLIHAGWSSFMLVFMAQLWWGLWNYRLVADWTFLSLLLLLSLSLSIVLAALAITPSDCVAPGLDLHAFFFANRRLFFGIGGALLIQIALADALVSKQPFLHLENGVRAAGLVLALLAARSDSVRLHGGIVAAGFVLLAPFIAWEIDG
jgi:hypothetical protein